VERALPQAAIAVLSGPTFAIEVARGLPTAVTLACADSELGLRLVEAVGTPSFRPYLSDDLVGAEIGGAVKNVLAIACGIVEGRGLGDNARAALITRGMAELTRLAVAKGGRAETLMGLAGLGDLILTASSTQSRNYSLGFAMGQGRALADILAERRAVTEGVWSAGAVVELAASLGIEMPICAGVDAVINKGVALDQVIRALLSRPFRSEGI
jgi:glycerol-3-phosphate dehydrogenase (NAD(P)+)